MDFAHTLGSSGSSRSDSKSRSSGTRWQKARSTDNYLSDKDDNRINSTITLLKVYVTIFKETKL